MSAEVAWKVSSGKSGVQGAIFGDGASACVGGSVEGDNSVVGWLQSFRLPFSQPLEPTASVVIREMVDVVDKLAAVDGEVVEREAL